jgi:sarcosine oxidase subunit gamma
VPESHDPTPPRRSALAGAPESNDLIQERTGLSIQRLYAPTGGFTGDIGLTLPAEANRASLNGGLHALWLAPGEWLLVGEAPDQAAKTAANAVAAGGALTDLSHARVVFRIPVEAAPRILAKGCPLDLRDDIFPPGSCAQSVLANVAILVHHLANGDHMDIYVARSYGRFMHDWLLDAAG